MAERSCGIFYFVLVERRSGSVDGSLSFMPNAGSSALPARWLVVGRDRWLVLMAGLS